MASRTPRTPRTSRTLKAAKRLCSTATTTLPDVVIDTLAEHFFELCDDKRDNFGVLSLTGYPFQLANVLLKFRRTCKRLQHLIDSNSRLRFYFFYFFTAASPSLVPRRFLDATFQVSLFSGSFGAGPANQERFNVLTPTDIVQDRVVTSRKLSEMEYARVVSRSATYLPTDLPANTGLRVAAFVGRCRFLAQHAANHSPHWTRTCDLCGCANRMLCAEGTRRHDHVNLFGDDDDGGEDDGGDGGGDDGSGQAEEVGQGDDGGVGEGDDVEDEEDEEYEDESLAYWNVICPTPLCSLPKFYFCSLGCLQSYQDELAAFVPFTSDDVARFEPKESKLGLARVLAAARGAYKRNDAAARALRDAKRSMKKRPSTVSVRTIEQLHKNIVDVLNVDLGVLVAAATLAQSPQVCEGLVLPATKPGWREDVKRFLRATERAKSLYARHAKGDQLDRDERFPSRFLQEAKRAAVGMFKRSLLLS